MDDDCGSFGSTYLVLNLDFVSALDCGFTDLRDSFRGDLSRSFVLSDYSGRCEIYTEQKVSDDYLLSHDKDARCRNYSVRAVLGSWWSVGLVQASYGWFLVRAMARNFYGCDGNRCLLW